jgi:glycine/D-amino acid oxidase-like deaminating enzyme
MLESQCLWGFCGGSKDVVAGRFFAERCARSNIENLYLNMGHFSLGLTMAPASAAWVVKLICIIIILINK